MASQVHMDLKGKGQPVTCLGQTFANDDERREHFRDLLRQRLADPEFRKRPGFPQGSDDNIIHMSDPPYYTACPNPFLDDFIAEVGSVYDPSEAYARAPMAIDVSVGKTDSLYRAHGYHTKVPHQAIVPSILHYTSPGDVVLDAFCGSGMTALAAQFCGVAPDEYKAELEGNWKSSGREAPVWGVRHAIQSDLSAAATFIASNYNIPFDVDEFDAAANRILEHAREQIGWMYETTSEDGRQRCTIDFTVWSEVFSCVSCTHPIVFASAEKVEKDEGRAKLLCPSCGALSKKEDLEIVRETFLDTATGERNWRPRREPVFLVAKVGKSTIQKPLDETDRKVLAQIRELESPVEIPLNPLTESKASNEGRMRTTNTQSVNQFFLDRPKHALSFLWKAANQEANPSLRRALLFWVEQAIIGMSVLNRYSPTHFSQVNRNLNGVFYVGSQHSECSPWYILEGKLNRLVKAFRSFRPQIGATMTSVGTAAQIEAPDSSIDYIFTDPPFGGNIYYADLNFVVEAFHRVFTQVREEAVVNAYTDKTISDYESMMHACFSECFRVLKPGRWMTVVFSNSLAAVWNAIQVALQQAGFVVAEVTALDKVQGSFKQVTSANAVKQDLVVSCYKPNGGLEDRFEARGLTEDTAWDFIRTHLKNLAVVKRNKGGGMDMVAERDARRLFDRMVAWFVRHNTPVPLSSAEFQAGLAERFPERDGMFFLPNQIDEYDKARMQAGDPPQRDLFVDDERTAIDWLTDFLKIKPSTYQEVHPEFTQKTGAGWRKHELKPELLRLLDENFLRFDGDGPVPSQIHRYLSSNWKELRNLEKDNPQLVEKARNRWFVPDPNKQQDVEARRDKALLREFETYKAHKGKTMKEIRLEVMRVGFKAAWAAKDYRTIIDVSAKVPDEVWQEDERLMMLHSMAETRLEAER